MSPYEDPRRQARVADVKRIMTKRDTPAQATGWGWRVWALTALFVMCAVFLGAVFITGRWGA